MTSVFHAKRHTVGGDRMLRISKSTLSALTLTPVVLSSTALFGQEKPVPGPPASLQETAGGPSIAAGITGGTLGIGPEASALISPYFVVRANATWISFRLDSLFSSLDNNYDFKLSEFTAGGLLDFHPFQNGFRIVSGARYADFNFDQHRSYSLNYNYTFNDHSYPYALVGTLHTDVSVKNPVAPYIGLGWDSSHYFSTVRGPDERWVEEKFTVGFDVGALYTGGVNVNMSTSRTVPGLTDDLAVESQNLKKTLNSIYLFYPVVMTTLKYRF